MTSFYNILMSFYNIVERIAILEVSSEHRRFHILPERGTEDIHDLAQRGVGFDSFDDGGHGVFAAVGGAAQVLQRAFDGGLVTFAAHAVEAIKVRALANAIDIECGNFDILIHRVVVDAYNGAPVGISPAGSDRPTRQSRAGRSHSGCRPAR